MTVTVATTAVLVGAAACSDGSRSAGPSATAVGTVAVTVTGDFGVTPTLGAPRSAAPTTVGLQVLKAGNGPALKTGQVLIAHYRAQTWEASGARAKVVADSFAAANPVAMPIGSGQAIKRWDTALAGQTIGSRVLLALPADAKVAAKNAELPAFSQALVMVVDLLAAVDADATATGEALTPTSAELPTVRSSSGRIPELTDIGRARKATAPASALLLRGTGPAIDPTKFLVLHLLQVDAVTGKRLTQSAGKEPYVMPAVGVLGAVAALKGAPVGSRAVSVVPKRKGEHGQILVVDVLAQV